MLPFKTAQVTASSWVHAVGQPDQPWVNHQLAAASPKLVFRGTFISFAFFQPTQQLGPACGDESWRKFTPTSASERSACTFYSPYVAFNLEMDTVNKSNWPRWKMLKLTILIYFGVLCLPAVQTKGAKLASFYGLLRHMACTHWLHTYCTGRTLQVRLIPSSASSRLCKSVVTIVKAGFPNVAQS